MAARWLQRLVVTLLLIKMNFVSLAIAFGRIGGQNVGAKLSKITETELEKLGYDVEQVIMNLQQNLLQGDLTLPEGLKKESFVDD